MTTPERTHPGPTPTHTHIRKGAFCYHCGRVTGFVCADCEEWLFEVPAPEGLDCLCTEGQ